MDAYWERYRRWLDRKTDRCEVRIRKPRMRIRGKSQGDYVAFLGIPYARPPVGLLRFEAPEPTRQVPFYRRTPLFRAYTEPKPCVQYKGREIIGSEDCLKLNIYTPEDPKDIVELLPVLVYIHGGAFEHGSGNMTDAILPNDIIKEELILVTINFRLGVFGFLNMRSKNCRGNAGMKDQVMALRWIKNNIVHFRGNPGNVTIMGHSAGGSSVNLHMVSPLSKGLFHKAIVQAGGIHCPWGFGGHAKEIKQLFKKQLNMENSIRHVVVETLKEKTAEELAALSVAVDKAKQRMELYKMTVFLRPSVECIKKDAFLPETVEKLIVEADPVPTIAGITKQEGYAFFHDAACNYVRMVKQPPLFIHFLKKNFLWSKQSAMKQFGALKKKYFPGEESMEDDAIKEHLATASRFVIVGRMITDLHFRRFYDNFKIGNPVEYKCPAPLYVYEFDYYGGAPIIPHPISACDRRPTIVPRAAQHGDDMFYIFTRAVIGQSLRRIERSRVPVVAKQMERVMQNMCNLCGSFCRDGVPRSRQAGDDEVEWTPHTEETPCYLHIGEKLTMRSGRLNEERWNDLHKICKLVPIVPSLEHSPQTPEK